MDWAPIPDFPGYSINYLGQVRNDRTGRLLVLTLSRARNGLVQVGLVKNGLQYKRGVALLVANAFLEPPNPPTFDTPINLDGDRTNNHVENLMWRPRWFAIKYHRQFYQDVPYIEEPIVDVRTEEIYPNSFSASVKYGLLDQDLYLSILNRTYVWPTYQRFRVAHQEE